MDFNHDMKKEDVTSVRNVTAYFKRAVTVDDIVFMYSRAHADARARGLLVEQRVPRTISAQVTRVPYAR
jgi:hypothetical protein